MASFVGSKMNNEIADYSIPSVEVFIPGQFISIAPLNQQTQFEITTPLGKGTGVLYSFLFEMSKNAFNISKVSEWSEISPVHSQYYQLTVQQKQQLEGQIKTALGGIATAVSDYELVAHDMRKYSEYIKYFQNIEKGKKEKNEELIKENDRVLKSIFIDQVDVHTGEAIALKLIAGRWPTIIVDFMRLGDDDLDPKKIAKKYEFTEAEGVVLATKNKLFVQWKDMFKDTVLRRFTSLKSLESSRKFSIQEYKNMAKPYINRYRHIREWGETDEGRAILRQFSWARSSTTAVSVDFAEYWLWKAFFVPELHKSTAELSDMKVNIKKIGFPEEFRRMIKNEWDDLKEDYKKIPIFPTKIEPIDSWVMLLKKKLEEHYQKTNSFKIILTAKDVLEARKNMIEMYIGKGWPQSPNFVTIQIPVLRIVIRLSDGSEQEVVQMGTSNDSPFKVILETQNVILFRLLELKLLEKEFEYYISDILGETIEGQKIDKFLKEQYPILQEDSEKLQKDSEKKSEKPKIKKGVEKSTKFMTNVGKKISLVKPGPYERVFIDRIASTYFKELAASTFVPAMKFLRNASGFPG